MMQTLVDLVKKKLLSVSDAAAQARMPEDEFRAYLDSL